MDKTTRQVAVILAALVFFVMALAGWLSGHEPAVCARRGMIGAVILYLTVRVAGNLVLRILVAAMIDDRVGQHNRNEDTGK